MRIALHVGIAAFAADQALKIWVLRGLELDRVGAIDVIDPFLNLRMAWNTGINFGLFAEGGDAARWTMIAVAVAVSAAALWWVRSIGAPPRQAVCAGLLAGGAAGNVVDRLVHGAVADFINMSCCGVANPFSFNLADAAVFAGALGLAFLGPGQKNR